MASLVSPPATPAVESEQPKPYTSPRNEGHEFFGIPTPRSNFEHSRHRPSLQEHAGDAQGAEMLSAFSTPRPELRHEGFSWDSAPTTSDDGQYCHRNSKNSDWGSKSGSISSEEPLYSEPHSIWRTGSVVNELSRYSSLSSSLTVNTVNSRANTSRSSVSSIARGLLRGIPDFRMLNLQENPKDKSSSKESVHKTHPGSVSRSRTFGIGARKKANDSTANISRRSSRAMEDQQRMNKPNSPPVIELDKEQVLKAGERSNGLEAPRPLQTPDVPPQSRCAITPSISDIPKLPRPHSPQTPLLLEIPPRTRAPIFISATSRPATSTITTDKNQLDSFGVVNPKAKDSKGSLRSANIENAAGRPGHFRSASSVSATTRSRTRKSDNSNALYHDLTSTPEDEQGPNLSQEGQGKRKHPYKRRFWGGPLTSGDEHTSNSAVTTAPTKPLTPKPVKDVFFRNPLKLRKRLSVGTPPHSGHQRKKSTASGLSASSSPGRKRGRSSLSGPDKSTETPKIATGPAIPFTFQPPGMNRIPTPPIFNSNGGLKGKLADFFFDYQRLGTPTQGGVWDSDAVLMSQQRITPDSENSESPSAAPQTAVAAEKGWFRVRLRELEKDDGSGESDEEDTSKKTFQWDVPEHLPGSPLCPLSPMHKSGGKGICVYHGRRRS
ncbi:hypothetical protein AOQ84DRAFT_373023 [Glonium stellatum]|uniref:Uncharacterized protein n=1 Tax=Glonium stellatum TaxID=574774 RepID=A0A8E2JWR2_9PEZI|nr:hypothetical protein AOQ84DRAFT_373023 [Glonium stellatum]